MSWVVKCDRCGLLAEATMVGGLHQKPKTFLQARLFDGQIIDACSIPCSEELGKKYRIEEPAKEVIVEETK